MEHTVLEYVLKVEEKPVSASFIVKRHDLQQSHVYMSSGIGVYISRIEEGSVAERSGLRPGDTILEVNGTPFSGMTHDEALTVNDMSFAFLMCMWYL